MMDRIDKRKRRNVRKWVGIIIPLAVIGFWVLAVLARFFPTYILPSPLRVAAASRELLDTGGLVHELGVTLLRVAEGFLVGSVLGFGLGALMGVSKTVEKILGPSFNLFRQVPLPGWIPILVIAFGNTEMSKIIFVAMGAFPPMAVNTYTGIRNVPQKLVEVARVFGFGPLKLFTRVVVPSATPHLLTGLKVSLNLAWMFVIAAELMTYSAGGLGNLLEGARDQFRMDAIIVIIVLIGIVGFIMNWGLERAQSLLVGDRKFS
jgi:sulfonate transport system permease protein